MRITGSLNPHGPLPHVNRSHYRLTPNTRNPMLGQAESEHYLWLGRLFCKEFRHLCKENRQVRDQQAAGSQRLQAGSRQLAAGSTLPPAPSLRTSAGSDIRNSWSRRKSKAGLRGLNCSFGSPAFSDGVGEIRSFPSAPHNAFGFSGTQVTSGASPLAPPGYDVQVRDGTQTSYD